MVERAADMEENAKGDILILATVQRAFDLWRCAHVRAGRHTNAWNAPNEIDDSEPDAGLSRPLAPGKKKRESVIVLH